MLTRSMIPVGGPLWCFTVGWTRAECCKPRATIFMHPILSATLNHCLQFGLSFTELKITSLQYRREWARILYHLIHSHVTLLPYSTFSTLDDAFHAGLKNYLACCSTAIQVGCIQNINTSNTQKTEHSDLASVKLFQNENMKKKIWNLLQNHGLNCRANMCTGEDMKTIM